MAQPVKIKRPLPPSQNVGRPPKRMRDGRASPYIRPANHHSLPPKPDLQGPTSPDSEPEEGEVDDASGASAKAPAAARGPVEPKPPSEPAPDLPPPPPPPAEDGKKGKPGAKFFPFTLKPKKDQNLPEKHVDLNGEGEKKTQREGISIKGKAKLQEKEEGEESGPVLMWDRSPSSKTRDDDDDYHRSSRRGRERSPRHHHRRPSPRHGHDTWLPGDPSPKGRRGDYWERGYDRDDYARDRNRDRSRDYLRDRDYDVRGDYDRYGYDRGRPHDRDRDRGEYYRPSPHYRSREHGRSRSPSPYTYRLRSPSPPRPPYHDLPSAIRPAGAPLPPPGRPSPYDSRPGSVLRPADRGLSSLPPRPPSPTSSYHAPLRPPSPTPSYHAPARPSSLTSSYHAPPLPPSTHVNQYPAPPRSPLASGRPTTPHAPRPSHVPAAASITGPAPTPAQTRPPSPKATPKPPKRIPKHRTTQEELAAYDRTFHGCSRLSAYELLDKLGEGTFGEVHKARSRMSGQLVALKRILMHEEKEGVPITALREVKLLKKLKHPNVVSVVDMVVTKATKEAKGDIYMVFPYMDHDLAGLLENREVKLTISQIKLYMKQLLEGTDYLHRNNILHRDMKAANLLISNAGVLQIADFGLARPGHSRLPPDNIDIRKTRYTNCVVTRWYRPPELLLGEIHYSFPIDMWGVGCVMGEMFLRKPMFCGSSDLNQLEKIWAVCGTPTEDNFPGWSSLPGCEGVKVWQRQERTLRRLYEKHGREMTDLLDKMLLLDPHRRITAAEALDHDWFWTDPLPADPKSLMHYEASHEYDKRKYQIEEEKKRKAWAASHPPAAAKFGPGPPNVGHAPGPGYPPDANQRPPRHADPNHRPYLPQGDRYGPPHRENRPTMYDNGRGPPPYGALPPRPDIGPRPPPDDRREGGGWDRAYRGPPRDDGYERDRRPNDWRDPRPRPREENTLPYG